MCSYFQEKLLSVLSFSPGSQSLRYNLTVKSQLEYVHKQFFAEGCFDDQPILQDDSKKGRAEPSRLWQKLSWELRTGTERVRP
jgi:hypothetical protein